MKIVKAKEMSRIESEAYKSGASEETFMEAAGFGVFTKIQEMVARYHLKPKIILLCGKGNNGGDAMVSGRHLMEAGEFDVEALCLSPKEECSKLLQLQMGRFKGKITFVKEAAQIDFKDAELIVDGIYGTGFKGEAQGLYREAIVKANDSKIAILAIDIPSGIDGNDGKVGGVAIKAKETLALGLPKSGCFFKEAFEYIGKIDVSVFGLAKRFIDDAQADFLLVEEKEVAKLLPKIKKTRHKYEAGYLVGVGGASGMPGAVLLACKAALRAGAGIVRLLHPEGMEAELSGAPYELIREATKGDTSSLEKAFEKASSHFIGPGMGKSENALVLLKTVLPFIQKPVVIDADALSLFAENPMAFPKMAILTPHHGEMARLLKLNDKSAFHELLNLTQQFADEKQVHIVLKGAPTFIFAPQKTPYVSPRGDPGMATAGTGDVLTGIIAALLAQGKNPQESAILGVYLHQLAGEEAAAQKTSYSMIATDLIEALPKAFERLLHL